jgi:hypothetical protein
MKAINNINLKVFAVGMGFVALAIFTPVFAYAQDLSVTGIRISDIKNNSAVIEWQTPNAKTIGTVYVGENQTNLDKTFKYGAFSFDHQVVISGIQKNKTYFYKIAVADKTGESREIFIRDFSTKQMADTIKPQILDTELVESAYGAVVLRWTTNEDTSSVIKYGTDINKLSNKSGTGAYEKQHEIILYDFGSGIKYHIEITVQDKDKNTSSKSLTATPIGVKKDAQLKISNISPTFFGQDSISARGVEISFKTNLAARSMINYGTDPKKLSSKIDVSKFLDLEHEVEIGNLQPHTTYFFTIKAYDSLYKESVTSEMLSFETAEVQARYPSGSLVRAKGDSKVYVISRDTKTWIENGTAFFGLGYKSSWVQEVDPTALKDYTENKSINNNKIHPDGTLIKYPGKSTVYFIEGNRKRPIGSAEAFMRNGFNWNWVMTVPNSERYGDGSYIN